MAKLIYAAIASLDPRSHQKTLPPRACSRFD